MGLLNEEWKIPYGFHTPCRRETGEECKITVRFLSGLFNKCTGIIAIYGVLSPMSGVLEGLLPFLASKSHNIDILL